MSIKKGLKIIVFGIVIGLFALGNLYATEGQGHENGGGEASATEATTEGSGGEAGEETPYPEIMLHHIKNSHNWHIATFGDFHVEVPLPWILYNSKDGVKFFANNAALEADPNYIFSHEHAYYVTSKSAEHHASEEGLEAGRYHEIEHGGHTSYYPTDPEVTLLDFSISKTAFQILLVVIFLIFLFTSVARFYKKNPGQAPKGLASFMEPLILFVKEDIADTYIGHKKSHKYLPYLLSVFFFIWAANLFGLTPFNFNITGNITITFMLAFLTLILTMGSTNKHFWGHVFWFPGAPVPVKLIMIPIELVGIIAKPFALMVRLFANISGGHFMVLSLIGLIFIMGNNGHSVGGMAAGTLLSTLFTLFIMTLELLVAALQAYVFTLLTAVFIGQAMEGDDH